MSTAAATAWCRRRPGAELVRADEIPPYCARAPASSSRRSLPRCRARSPPTEGTHTLEFDAEPAKPHARRRAFLAGDFAELVVCGRSTTLHAAARETARGERACLVQQSTRRTASPNGATIFARSLCRETFVLASSRTCRVAAPPRPNQQTRDEIITRLGLWTTRARSSPVSSRRICICPHRPKKQAQLLRVSARGAPCECSGDLPVGRSRRRPRG